MLNHWFLFLEGWSLYSFWLYQYINSSCHQSPHSTIKSAFLLQHNDKGKSHSCIYISVSMKTTLLTFCWKKNCICIIKMAISLGRENSLHAEERKCQTGEQSICSREGYNYLIHLNNTGHWSCSSYFAWYSGLLLDTSWKQSRAWEACQCRP